MSLNVTASARPCILVSWDGQNTPLRLLALDAVPQFDLLLFDYSGRQTGSTLTVGDVGCKLLAKSTECKGQVYQALAEQLAGLAQAPEYVALIDDDILLRVSDLNHALHIGRAHALDVFSPCLSHDSHHSHGAMLKRGHHLLHWVDWVEVMMPFYRGDLFLAGTPHYRGNVSSWGIDRYLMPSLQRLRGQQRTAVLNTIVASHVRPISSNDKVFSHGLTAAQECERLKAHCTELLRQADPAILHSDWYHRLFEVGDAQTPWQRGAYRAGRRIRRWLEMST